MEKRPTPEGREQVRETPTEARQANKGRPVAMVLMVSLAIGLVALIVLMLWALMGDDPAEPIQDQQGSLSKVEHILAAAPQPPLTTRWLVRAG